MFDTILLFYLHFSLFSFGYNVYYERVGNRPLRINFATLASIWWKKSYFVSQHVTLVLFLGLKCLCVWLCYELPTTTKVYWCNDTCPTSLKERAAGWQPFVEAEGHSSRKIRSGGRNARDSYTCRLVLQVVVHVCSIWGSHVSFYYSPVILEAIYDKYACSPP